MFGKNLVRFKGLNRRQVSVDRLNVLFLEEVELEGNLVTNIHFANGKWVTTAHPITEVEALLSETKREEDAESAQVQRWRENARSRMRFQKETEAALEQLKRANINMPEATAVRSETLPDGSMRVTLEYTPDQKKAIDDIFDKIEKAADAPEEPTKPV